MVAENLMLLAKGGRFYMGAVLNLREEKTVTGTGLKKI